jgi:valyl-tRNA synthetase
MKTLTNIWVRCGAEDIDFHCDMVIDFKREGFKLVDFGPDVSPPENCSSKVMANGDEIFVECFIDAHTELLRQRCELKKLEPRIIKLQANLCNEKFVERAPASVVQKARDQLVDLEKQQAIIGQRLQKLERIDDNV